MTTLTITDTILTIDSTDIELQRLPEDTKVHAWEVPTAYRPNGYFVTTQRPGHPREIPACDSRSTTYLGAIDYPADQATADLHRLPELRWRHETKGITWQNLPVATDRDSQGKMTSAMLGIVAGIRADGAQWKFADGIARPLTNAEFTAIATAANAHVQACFDHEATLAAQLRDAQTPDITTGWPE